jgi:Immunoglobulin-like domain of bacterial spore germination/Sporulation and spore germination
MTPTDDDDRIRGLLERAVSDVEPEYALDRIRARTTVRSRRTWAWGAGGAALAAAATVAVVVALGGLPGRPGPGRSDPGRGPAASGAASPTARAGGVYLVGDTLAGPRLFLEPLHGVAPQAALDRAVDDAVSGRAADQDYGTLWPSGTVLQKAQLSDGVLSVDLSGPVVNRPAGMTRENAAMALQQLVYTAQATARTRLPVTFLVDGRPTRTLLGEPTGRPVRAAAADSTLAPVSVTSPVEGATVTSPFTVSGRAAAFEATVQWELLRAGSVVKRGFGTAKECCTLSPYSFSVSAPPGHYTLVVHDEAVSEKEGPAPSKDTKQITVR